jgi:uncharacterized protein
MRADTPTTIDLDALALRSGEGERLDLDLEPDRPALGGERLQMPDPVVSVRIEVSRTTSGYALRLRVPATIVGTCARCLGPATLELSVDAREVDQASVADEELISPYVEEGVLDVGAWTRDAITLALPKQLLCREDCAGLCETCGANLNEFEPGGHVHEQPPDPRFAKLRELTE